MARPKKVDLEAIEKAYKEGIEVNEIVKHYKVAKTQIVSSRNTTSLMSNTKN